MQVTLFYSHSRNSNSFVSTTTLQARFINLPLSYLPCPLIRNALPRDNWAIEGSNLLLFSFLIKTKIIVIINSID